MLGLGSGRRVENMAFRGPPDAEVGQFAVGESTW